MTSVKEDIYINFPLAVLREKPIYPVPLCFHCEVSSDEACGVHIVLAGIFPGISFILLLLTFSLRMD